MKHLENKEDIPGIQRAYYKMHDQMCIPAWIHVIGGSAENVVVSTRYLGSVELAGSVVDLLARVQKDNTLAFVMPKSQLLKYVDRTKGPISHCGVLLD